MTPAKQKPGAGTPGKQNHLGEVMLTEMVAQTDGRVKVNFTLKATDKGQQYSIDRFIGSGALAVAS